MVMFNPGTYIARVYDVDGEYKTYGIKFQIYVTVNG